MAKYRHRIFEMYDFHDEAVRALKPQGVSPVIESIDTGSWGLKLLAVSQSAGFTNVDFMESQTLGEGIESDFGMDLALLASKLANGSKVLLDFSGLTLFSKASLDSLISFNLKLRHKGSRIVLCCLEPAVRDSFFPQVE